MLKVFIFSFHIFRISYKYTFQNNIFKVNHLHYVLSRKYICNAISIDTFTTLQHLHLNYLKFTIFKVGM